MYVKKGPGISNTQAFFGEVIVTGQLILTILITSELLESPILCSLASIISIYAGSLSFGQISGPGYNPTVCLSINTIQAIKTRSWEPLREI